MGGGVVLTLIHEIDYFLDLFSNHKIKIISSIASKNSELEIDVEDTLNSSFVVTNKKEKFTVNLHLNYYTRPEKRYIKIIFEKGVLFADFNKNYFQVRNNKKIFKKYFVFSRNLAFMNEMKFFVKSILKKKIIKQNYSIHNGIKTLQFALNLKNFK